MYSRFFGFEERPFKLVPNPAYLFLSKSHEEVMAHLTYAVNHGDGFVEITGEVGTGKTTLCRVFIENLDADVEAAYIFNPKLDAVQLLQTINREFCIDARADNCKDLIDTLNAFLMNQRSAERKVILIIDEAQNLGTEVLEQLRLLSNLETTQNKLLQIILVGQPELNEMLNSYELRQLGQRISLSCRLKPLSLAETGAYIRHRIQISSRKTGDLFSPSAVRAIHKYAGGIPRLINIACDRALLIAYGRSCRKISGRIAAEAIKELTQHETGKLMHRRLAVILALAIVSLVLIGGLIYGGANMLTLKQPPARYNISQSQGERPVAATPAPSVPAVEPSDTGAQQSETDLWALPKPEFPVNDGKHASAALGITEAQASVTRLRDVLSALQESPSRRAAAQNLLALWQRTDAIPVYFDDLADADEFFGRIAQQNGLQRHRISGDIALVKKLNLPAILVFNLPGRPERGYLALHKVAAQDVILANGDLTIIVADPGELEKYYAKTAYVFWQNFMALDGLIPLTSSDGTIMSLKILLKEIGFDGIRVDERYDFETQQAVRSVQKRHGLKADGYVGPLTKIVLYNEKADLPIPHLGVSG